MVAAPASPAVLLARLVGATRAHPDILLGVSPRGGVALQRAAQAVALLAGRDFVTPDDVKTVAAAVMGHRTLTRTRGLAAAQAAVQAVLETVRVPV